MKNIKLKSRLFFLPYFIVNTTFTIVYTFIVWYFYIRNGVIHSIDSSTLTFFVPAIVLLVLFLIFLTPKLKFAIFARGQIGGMIAFTILSTMFATITSAATIRYILHSCTPIIRLKNPSQIDDYPLNGFYVFDEIKFAPNKSTHEWYLSGKRKTQLNFNLIMQCGDLGSNKYNYWILEHRDSSVSKSVSAQNAYEKILENLDKYLDTVNYSNVTYFEREIETETRKNILRMVDQLSTNNKKNIVLEPIRKPLKKRIKKDLILALSAWGGFSILWFIFSISVGISTLKIYDYQQRKR